MKNLETLPCVTQHEQSSTRNSSGSHRQKLTILAFTFETRSWSHIVLSFRTRRNVGSVFINQVNQVTELYGNVQSNHV